MPVRLATRNSGDDVDQVGPSWSPTQFGDHSPIHPETRALLPFRTTKTNAVLLVLVAAATAGTRINADAVPDRVLVSESAAARGNGNGNGKKWGRLRKVTTQPPAMAPATTPSPTAGMLEQVSIDKKGGTRFQQSRPHPGRVLAQQATETRASAPPTSGNSREVTTDDRGARRFQQSRPRTD